jgi:hypothetical protein
MSLRGQPISEHATLDGGGSVEVWVGVPEDSYVPASERSTVDIQLREAGTTLASVTTVLDPDQVSEARALAREVRAGIESGELALKASALEQFADRLR